MPASWDAQPWHDFSLEGERKPKKKAARNCSKQFAPSGRLTGRLGGGNPSPKRPPEARNGAVKTGRLGGRNRSPKRPPEAPERRA